MKKINLPDKFSLITEHWTPKVVAELNGQHVKLAKLQGEFIWHKHDEEDELFMVIKGVLKIEFRDKVIEIKESEMLVVPRGVEHKPFAEKEVWLMMFEPAGTLNTGDVQNERTKEELDII